MRRPASPVGGSPTSATFGVRIAPRDGHRPRRRRAARHDLLDVLDDVIARFLATKRPWTIAFTGGERLVHPRFTEICSRLATHFKIYLDTNLSLPVDELVEAVPPARMEQVYAACHMIDRVRRRNMDVFVRNVQLLQERGYSLSLNYVMYPPLVGVFEKHRTWLAKHGIVVTPKPFMGTFGGRLYPESYTEDERELIRRYARGATRTRRIPNYRGRRCNAGSRLVRILEDGNMTRCVTDTTSLGNVFTGFRLFDEPRPCTVTRCPCYGPKTLFDGIAQQARIPVPASRPSSPTEAAAASSSR